MTDDELKQLLGLIDKMAQGIGELSRRLRVEKQAVEALYAVAYGKGWEMDGVLDMAKKAVLASADAPKDPPTTAYYLTRFDELIAIKKTSFKPTLH